MKKVILQARCLHAVIKEELEELNRRTDVSQWLLRKVMLNDPDPEEEDEECNSSPLGVVTMLKAAVAATALWAMMSAAIILLG